MIIVILVYILLAVGNTEQLLKVAISSATARSSNSHYPPNLAFDGKNSTFWHSWESDEVEWLKLETETMGIVRKVVIINR